MERHTFASKNRFHVVANGFDEQIFSEVENAASREQVSRRPYITLLHSGVLYPGDDRDPTPFFHAMSQLRAEGLFDKIPIRVKLRASGFDEIYDPLIGELGLEGIIELLPHVDYRAAIREMLSVDGLLLFQGRTSNPAIPAKLYEYFRARKPILAFVHSKGETARLLSSVNVGIRVAMEDVDAIKDATAQFLSSIISGVVPTLTEEEIDAFSRSQRAHEYEQIIGDTLKVKMSAP